MIFLLLFGFAAPLVFVLWIVLMFLSAWPLLLILIVIWIICLAGSSKKRG